MRYCPQCGQNLIELPLAGRERMTCPDHQCGWVHWDNPLPVVAAIVEHVDSDGQIVLARNKAWPGDFYALITGFLERDESPEEGVAREVQEELSLETIATELVGVYPFTHKNELIIAYHVVARGEIVLNEELAAYKLVEPKDLQPWDAGTGWALRDWMKRRGL